MMTQIGSNPLVFHENLSSESSYKPVFCVKGEHSDEGSARYLKEKKIRVLSFDGGGTRGIMPIWWAAEIERETGLNIADIFDLIAGTSVGGLITTVLLTPDPNDQTKPRYSAQWLEATFPTSAQQIFPESNQSSILKIWETLKSWGNQLNHPKYSSAGLQKFGEEYLQNALLENSLKPFVIPTYQACEEMKTRFLTRKIVQQPFWKGIPSATAALMTSAAPTYFPPTLYKGYEFLDGGLFANNPSLAALTAAKEEYGPQNKFVVCSFGTGITPTGIDKKGVPPSNHWGLLQLAPNLLDLLLNAQIRAVDTLMRQNPPYFRFQAEIPNLALDDASPQTMNFLISKAKEVKEKHPDEWRKLLMDLQKAENTEPYAQPGLF